MSPPCRFSLLVAAVAIVVTAPSTGAAQKRRAQTAPEAFTSALQAKTGAGAAAAQIRIQIDRYISEDDRKRLTDALTHGGYPAFVEALKKAPAIGFLEFGGQKFPLRWARELPTDTGGRAISVCTDAPVYFIGGGRADAKPREGFQLAVVQLAVDDYGIGTGTMAAAARVKPDGRGGVVIEDYAEQPIKLTSVHREIG
jgi:hypothetical protein